jgi:F-type H+-transporting ATPase subunit alpha
MQGEIAAYIPTNLISITDGQLYLDQDLFAGGFRPAIDIRRSVSRIGGQAQHPRIKEEAGRMKLDYLQFLELEVFSRFGARLEASMETAIRRGNLLREILKQERLTPLPVEFQMAWLVAFNDGLFDGVEVDSITPLLASLQMEIQHWSVTLDDPRELWATTVSQWLQTTRGQPPQ